MTCVFATTHACGAPNIGCAVEARVRGATRGAPIWRVPILSEAAEAFVGFCNLGE